MFYVPNRFIYRIGRFFTNFLIKLHFAVTSLFEEKHKFFTSLIHVLVTTYAICRPIKMSFVISQ